MGASASHGQDNESLMDKLVESGYTLPPQVERAMRLVDRGSYFEEKSDRAYMDLAWRSGSLHLSAPSIYMTALGNLDLHPGLHFLNVGSGSGYLSTIIGLILGYSGVNHGIELNSSNVEFAKARLAKFLSESDAPFERDFCIPQFVQGNIFDLVVPVGDGRTFASLRTVQSERGGDSDPNAISQSTPEQTPTSPGQVIPMNLDSDNENNEEPREQSVPANGLLPDPVPVPPRENRENSDSSEGEDEDAGPPIGSRGSSNDPWIITVEPPPVVETHSSEISSNGLSFVQWPLYDRIYVGAAIQSVTQFLAILRLLKIGGIMIAPVRDKFIKITRKSEDVFDRVNLLSVSFAPLILPEPETRASVGPPPRTEIPTLEELTSRVLRIILRRVTLQRHNGVVPTIGRLEEVNSTERPRKRQNCSHRDATAGKNTVSTTDNSTKPSCSVSAEKKSLNYQEAPEDEHLSGGTETLASGQEDERMEDVQEGENNDDDDNEDEDCGDCEDEDDAVRSHSPTDSSSVDQPRSSGGDSPPMPRGSMARLFHHMLLRSGIIQSTIVTRNQPAPAGDISASTNQPDDSSGVSVSVGNSSNSRDSRSILLFRWIRNTEPDQSTESHESQQPTLSTDVASGASNADTTEHTDTTERTAEETEPSNPPTGTRARNRRVQRRKKRQSELRYIPPNYQFKEEMHKILCEDLGAGEHYARIVLTL